MARDDEGPPTPRAIPMRPPRRDTPPTRPSPARSREQGPMPPRPEGKDVPVPTLATVYGAITVLIGRIGELEKLVQERGSAPPSEVLTFSGPPTPTPAELLAKPPATPPPESRPSLPVRAAKATGLAAKAVGKNQIVRGVLLAAGVFPYLAQVVAWFRKVDVGPIVSALRLLADTIEGLSK